MSTLQDNPAADANVKKRPAAASAAKATNWYALPGRPPYHRVSRQFD